MQRLSLDQGWRFHLGDPPGVPYSMPDDTDWRVVDLPHDWSIELARTPDAPSGDNGGYFQTGRGWYRRTFVVPEEWSDRSVFVEFEGIYENAEIWVNEDLVERHPYGYTSFYLDITPYVTVGDTNVLTVKVDNAMQKNSRWYSGSGIYRHVWLHSAEPVHVAHWGVCVAILEASATQAVIEVATTINNDDLSDTKVQLLSSVLTHDDKVLVKTRNNVTLRTGQSRVCVQRFTVEAPHLWSPESPYLYGIETNIILDGAIVDTTFTPFGIRTLEFSATQGFLLNGQETKLRGGCVHHDNGILGAASYDRAEERKVELHKANGFNAIRCAHNPPSPAFLDACDRLGMLVIDEAFDCWHEGKTPYDYHIVFDDWWQRDLESMVLRDRNHPSIIMWSIGNEVFERNGRSNGAAVARALADYTRSLDPTRPITSAICGSGGAWRWEQTDAVFQVLDVGGYNYQETQYRSDHERHPERVMYGAESTAREALEHLEAVETLPYVIGDFVWTSLDYFGESGIGRVTIEGEESPSLGAYPWHQANCGDLDLCGFKRPQSYYRDILWHRGEPLYIAVHEPPLEGKTQTITYWGWPLVHPSWTWPGSKDEIFKVDVYSACEEVELLLNGKSLGKQPTGKAQRYVATFEVPYIPGVLRAVGYTTGKPTATWELRTAGSPVSIRLTPDRARLQADNDDLAYITVEVVDAQGRVHPQADNLIFLTIQGEGVIAAVGNADPMSEASYRGNGCGVFEGKGLVVVKTTGAPGTITLRAQADSLDPAAVTLEAIS